MVLVFVYISTYHVKQKKKKKKKIPKNFTDYNYPRNKFTKMNYSPLHNNYKFTTLSKY